VPPVCSPDVVVREDAALRPIADAILDVCAAPLAGSLVGRDGASAGEMDSAVGVLCQLDVDAGVDDDCFEGTKEF
jgi:hypothetical protein